MAGDLTASLMGKTTAFAFPLHIGDWMKGTARLLPAARAFYLDLLAYQWDSDEPIPEDENEQMQIARCTDRKEWRAAWSKLKGKFERVDGGYRNARVEQERARLQKVREQRSTAGANGNAKRWGSRRDTHRESDRENVAGAIASDVTESSRQNRLPSSYRDLPLETKGDLPPVPPTPDGAGESAVADDFDAFWAEYPRKIAKVAAQRAWRKLRPSADMAVLIVNAVRQHVRQPQWQRDGGAYIPHPATWLNQRRWEDDIHAGARSPDQRPGAYSMAWWDECKRDHDGQCPNRNQHDIRVFRETHQETETDDDHVATAQ